VFIQKWIPSLRGYSVKIIHAPWTMNNQPHGYPRRLIDHTVARLRALDAFSVVAETVPTKLTV